MFRVLETALTVGAVDHPALQIAAKHPILAVSAHTCQNNHAQVDQTPHAVPIVSETPAWVPQHRKAKHHRKACMRRIHDPIYQEDLLPEDEVLLPHRDEIAVRVLLVALDAHVVVFDACIGRDFPHFKVLHVENHGQYEREKCEEDHD